MNPAANGLRSQRGEQGPPSAAASASLALDVGGLDGYAEQGCLSTTSPAILPT